MCKLSTSKMRAANYTAFEIEIANYITRNDIQAGATFQGVPGHARYGASTQNVNVLKNNDEYVEFSREAKGGPKLVTIPVAEFSAEKTASAASSTTTTTTTTTAPAANNDALGALSALLNQQQNIGYEKAKAESAAEIERLNNTITELKEKGTGTAINVTINGETKKSRTDKVLNEHFEDVLTLLASGCNVYLYGPAGSGKNVMCEDLAKALGVDFYYQNTIVTKFDLSGYKNAQGEFEATEFYKAWTRGGLFMCDELDNSQAEAIIALNAALANGYFTFPGIGKVAKHEDFYCIAAGNTNGQGATEEYCGRYQMDESSRDRFAFVEIGYDGRIENAICGEHTDVAEFVRDLRAAAAKLQIKIIAGYRAISNLTKFYDKDTKFVLNAFVFRGMCKDDIIQLSVMLKTKNKYTKAIEEMTK